jgi:hypothetical protein
MDKMEEAGASPRAGQNCPGSEQNLPDTDLPDSVEAIGDESLIGLEMALVRALQRLDSGDAPLGH